MSAPTGAGAREPGGGSERFPPTWPRLALLAALALLSASVAIAPKAGPPIAAPGTTIERAAPETQARGSTEVVAGAAGVTGEDPGVRARAASPAAGAGRRLACAPGRNGGSTDVGVTADAIKLGATVVESGIGASFLRDARFGMLAAANKVNRAGGICGRRVVLKLVDDGWDFQRGGEFIRNLVEGEKVFALAVVPSSEGLKNVSEAGYLRRMRVPVVGTDGMLIHQYTDPYIWPVAASTISAMHIMAKQAYDAGARNFGIVYEHTYHFGIEGAYAFNAAVKRLTGRDIPGYSNPLKAPRCQERFCGIQAGASSYTIEVQTFNQACLRRPRCDFIALLLEPATALAWLGSGSLAPEPGLRMGGPQPLFNRGFAEACGDSCDDLWVWTGFYPPVGSSLERTEVAAYVDDIRATSSTSDYENTFVEGAYVGMTMLVEALRAVGPDLTREKLAGVLDSFTFKSGLAEPLAWRPGKHFANTRMYAFSIRYKGGFAGWRDERTSLTDPWVGRDIP